MGTVHAFAYRALGEPIVAESKVKEWNEAYPDFALSSHSATPDDAYGTHDNLTTADTSKLEVSRLRTLGRDPLLAQHSAVSGFHVRWEDWKRQTGYLDFVDMVDHALHDVERAPGDPAVIINDESQDTGPAEMRLLFKWADAADHLVLAGDPQQSLFSFRGSDPILLQTLHQKHDPDRPPLPQSYRLSRAVYDCAYEWAGQFEQTQRVAFAPRDAQGTVEEASFGFDQFTEESVEELVHQYGEGDGSGAVPLMFLTSCGFMLDPLIKALRASGTPFYNPWRPNHGGWNPLPQKKSKGLTLVDRVLAFLRPLPEVWGEQARFWTAADLRAWADILPATNVFTRGGVSAIKALKDSATDEEISKAFTTWFQYEERLHMVPRPDLEWYLAHATKTSDRFRDYVSAVIRNHGAKVLKEKPRVAVGTIHSTKGSEAATVVLCPDLSYASWQASQETEEAREDIRRMFYVGLTRARERLLLCQPSSRFHVNW
jgi:superfamily I DNA/RNA helicase